MHRRLSPVLLRVLEQPAFFLSILLQFSEILLLQTTFDSNRSPQAPDFNSIRLYPKARAKILVATVTREKLLNSR